MGDDAITAEELPDPMETDHGDEPHPPSQETVDGAVPGFDAAENAAARGEDNSVDKIREILFGNQKRDFNKRLSEIEAGFRKELDAIRHEQNQRHEALETYIHREIDALIDQVQNEQRQRGEQIRELSGEVEKIRKAHDKRMETLYEDARKTAKDFRQQLLEQTKALSGEIRRKSEEMASQLASSQQDLRDDVVDRSSLGALFTRMGMQLASDVTGPGEDR